MTTPQTTSATYEVGYRKPPRHTQFRKGQSGNPGGRPRGPSPERFKWLGLQGAYRQTVGCVDGRMEPMRVIQTVVRSQLDLAAAGNVRAQCSIMKLVRDIEIEN